MVRAMVYGEILWDIFGGEKTIGGAPFNFAAHLAALGGNAEFCSAVGRDTLGGAALECIRHCGVSEKYTARVTAPTGACHVTLDGNGTPKYDLLRNVAYDSIPMPELTGDYDLLYLGTLARRSAVSRNTARALLMSGNFREIFVDINVRKPDISREVLKESLRYATILKLSREEAGCLWEFGLLPEQKDETALAETLSKQYPNLRLVLLTLDREGALLYEAESGCVIRSVRPVNPLVSAVGAGDSFSACFAWNYLNGASLGESLNRGVLLSDYVVTQLGAVPEIPPELMDRIR